MKICEDRFCPNCKTMKTTGDFYINRRRKDGLQIWCKDCNRVIAKEHYQKSDKSKQKIQSRKYLLRSVYGMTLEDYDELLASQDYVCAICGEPEKIISNKKGGVDNLRVDHCHTTGDVRGLLCSECNLAIGKFKDNMGLLISATEYLLKHKQKIKKRSEE